MAMDPVTIWTSELSTLKVDGGKKGSWADNIAKVVDARVTSKLAVAGLTGTISFTFNRALFATLLKTVVPNPNRALAVQPIVDAWQAAVSASTIVIAPSTYVGLATPATTFSVVAASSVLPPSITVGAGILRAKLLANAPVPAAMSSQLGPALHAAFSALQVTASGTNSAPTTAPLSVPSAPVI